jgi:hypothetical protein
MGVAPKAMTLMALCQAIPPAYTRYIGEHLRSHLEEHHLIG